MDHILRIPLVMLKPCAMPIPGRDTLVIILSLICWLAWSVSLAPTAARSARAGTSAAICNCAHCPGGAACCCAGCSTRQGKMK